jgi:hypothetical protein
MFRSEKWEVKPGWGEERVLGTARVRGEDEDGNIGFGRWEDGKTGTEMRNGEETERRISEGSGSMDNEPFKCRVQGENWKNCVLN